MNVIESILSAIFGPQEGRYTAERRGDSLVIVHEKGRKHPFVVIYRAGRDPIIAQYDFPFIEKGSRTYRQVLRAANEVR